jgi:hypothetical protein
MGVHEGTDGWPRGQLAKNTAHEAEDGHITNSTTTWNKKREMGRKRSKESRERKVRRSTIEQYDLSRFYVRSGLLATLGLSMGPGQDKLKSKVLCSNSVQSRDQPCRKHTTEAHFHHTYRQGQT